MTKHCNLKKNRTPHVLLPTTDVLFCTVYSVQHEKVKLFCTLGNISHSNLYKTLINFVTKECSFVIELAAAAQQ